MAGFVEFRDREEAARLLAERLAGYKGQRPLVLAVPRGAVPMGRIIADALDGDLDVVLVRKLGAPGYPELALGAVDEVVCLLAPEWLGAVGQFFSDFSQVEDDEVIRLLAGEAGPR